ncbi:unnamed protein product [Microthlaspi erraticum]|uniref:Phylloplanin-like n=1 Tax=Microthlaspi erraticum TaxID=1685480 RepID=A0A6D2J7Z9_9BRAS|nr:unnamed protein product [Microthlaspi erraticum]CAA7046110.1 unnamed protein product [Microthlaspi erraticum]
MVRSNVYLISILVIMTSLSSPSHGLVLGDLPIGSVAIFGLARCDLKGDPNTPPISGGTVVLTCGGLTDNLAETITNPGGYFLIFLNFLETLFFHPSICNIRIYLPTGDCTISSPNAVLTGSLTFLNVVLTNNTNVAYYGVGPLVSGIVGT